MSYIVMEYVPYDFYNFCETMGGMGEDAGRFFLHHVIDVL